MSVHDRKEVAKFEAERAKAKWQTVRASCCLKDNADSILYLS